MEYKINVPDGCKVMNVEVTNNRIILEVEKEEPKFKENDIVTCETEGIEWIAIFKDKIDAFSFRAKALYTTVISQSDWCSYGERCRFASDSEKQLLFDKLKEKCLMFDGENIVRWRAGRFKEYYSVYGSGLVSLSKDAYIIGDEHERRYNIGNYFPTKEMAEAFQKVYIESLNNFHKNL